MNLADDTAADTTTTKPLPISAAAAAAAAAGAAARDAAADGAATRQSAAAPPKRRRNWLTELGAQTTAQKDAIALAEDAPTSHADKPRASNEYDKPASSGKVRRVVKTGGSRVNDVGEATLKLRVEEHPHDGLRIVFGKLICEPCGQDCSSGKRACSAVVGSGRYAHAHFTSHLRQNVRTVTIA